MSTATTPAWGTSIEAARILGVSTATAMRWAKQGLIRRRELPNTKPKFSLVDAMRIAGDTEATQSDDKA